MRIGVYSGSFNPVHVGHIALADYIVNENLVDEVWLIRSPQNPLKCAGIADCATQNDYHRAEMLKLAVKGHKGLKISTIEDGLPRPNYTITTLRTLQQQNPDDGFYLIIGADNWEIFHRWREWDNILKDFHLIVYPRPGYRFPEIDKEKYPSVQSIDAPMYDVSSTSIRERCHNGQDIVGLVADDVEEYIKMNRLYI